MARLFPLFHPNITITVGEYPAWDVNQDGRVSIHRPCSRCEGIWVQARLLTCGQTLIVMGLSTFKTSSLSHQHIGETTSIPLRLLLLSTDSKELTPVSGPRHG